VVFAAMVPPMPTPSFFRDEFASSGVLRNVVMFVNLADDPPVERLTLPRTALTAAEYLAFDLDRHVLVVMTDMTYYAEALREVATCQGRRAGAQGLSRLSVFRPGRDLRALPDASKRHGSITMMPVVSMPSDDITHPIPGPHRLHHRGPDRARRDLNNQGVYPPVTHLAQLSRLMKDGIGKDDTREDHPHVAGQLYASYARALEVRNLASIIGADELSDSRPPLPHLCRRLRAALRRPGRGRGPQHRSRPSIWPGS
jgi:V/A-type H+/Na+-transporting ATPase subunit B